MSGVVIAFAREAARNHRQAQAQAERQYRTEIREAERLDRMALREQVAAQRSAVASAKEQERISRALYLQEREDEVRNRNNAITERLSDFSRILDLALAAGDTVEFDSLRILDEPPRLDVPGDIQNPRDRPEAWHELIPLPSGLKRFVPGVKRKYELDFIRLKAHYERELVQWEEAEQGRLQTLTEIELTHSARLLAYDQKRVQRNAEVDDFEVRYQYGDTDAILSYCSMVLERSVYPEGFPQHFSLAYTTSSKQLVIEYELPQANIIPGTTEVRYTKTADQIIEKPRKISDIREAYQDVVSSITLRTIYELLASDPYDHIDVVCFNGYVRTIDLATGHDIAPHLISLRVSKEQFTTIDLARVDRRTCLRTLGANVSRQPEEASPVRPIVEFDMADSRFVDQTDLISTLSSTMNLMDLNPYEFEHLVANLFSKMGLESRLTRSSRDGGVDCVAYDSRPILGGKVVIQAKRYKHTVSVSAVRDLYGTMMNEGANKGILVTTSGFGPSAFEFSSDKPIELIDGSGLLFLLQGVGVNARIVFSDL